MFKIIKKEGISIKNLSINQIELILVALENYQNNLKFINYSHEIDDINKEMLKVSVLYKQISSDLSDKRNEEEKKEENGEENYKLKIIS